MTEVRRETNPAAAGEPCHVLVDSEARWHSNPINDDRFQALVEKQPRLPLRYHWKHFGPGWIPGSPATKAFDDAYPGFSSEKVEDIFDKILREEVAHARHFLRIGETNAMGGEITEETRVRIWGHRLPEEWALAQARDELRKEREQSKAAAEFTWGATKPNTKPKRRRMPKERCPESGRVTFFEPTPGLPEYDRCPNCGRSVRIMADGRVPEHTYPAFLRHD